MIGRSKIHWIGAGTTLFIIISGLFFFFFYYFLPDKTLAAVQTIKENFKIAILIVVFLFVLFSFLVDSIFRYILMPLDQLADEISLIGMVNSKYRLQIQGNGIFAKLVRSINAIAVRFEAMQRYDREKIDRVKESAEKERNILASTLAELPQGVLICNAQGRIILYNPRAKKFFNPASSNPEIKNSPMSSSKRFVGLGRSIYDILDKNLVAHALDEITYKLKHMEKNVATYFVTVSADKELLRVEMVAVLNDRKQFAGFILIFQDITYHLRAAGQSEAFLKSLVREIRASSAGIRSTIEAILQYPDMEPKQLDRFRGIIHQESIMLGSILDKINMEGNGPKQTEWPLVRMNAYYLFSIVKTKAKEKLGIDVRIEIQKPAPCIKADAYSMIMAVLFILGRIRKETGPVSFTAKIHRNNKFVNFDFSWEGRPVKVEMLRKWENLELTVNRDRLPFTLKEVVGHHEGELCAYSEPGIKSGSYLRFFLPECQEISEKPTRTLTVLSKSRPEFFDFNLFQNEDLQIGHFDQPLTDLSYTVFDTETTGLDPDGGDEIISVGAVRIVNGRILQEEKFNQLIDPNRSIPKASIQFHGIRPQDIEGKPRIKEVLPEFKTFVSDTILVAHNAAFDMRMLQVKEKATGVSFHNPVLDTLLLSAVIHPSQNDHCLETIANRLGVSIKGRHTAMGDAMMTAELFLNMIPLLADKGLCTLGAAMAASKKTFYARISY